MGATLDASADSRSATTLNFADFHIHPVTGFIPSDAPLARLPVEFEAWESALDDAVRSKLQVGATFGLADAEKVRSETWRSLIRQLPVIPIDNLKDSEILLHRAHAVLAYLVHFYAHTLPPDARIHIPASISLPLLQISAELDMPPIMTLYDEVLTNWTFKDPVSEDLFDIKNIIPAQRSFTGTLDEESFNLAPLRVELRGAEALGLIQKALHDIALPEPNTIINVTETLNQLVPVFQGMKDALLGVRDGCNPDVFYRKIRPWLIGGDGHPLRKWTFEGIDSDPSLSEPINLSGSSAAQSPIIQALDGLLGVEKPLSSSNGLDPGSVSASTPFAHRMRVYMTRRHREFLAHLTKTGSALRSFVESSQNSKLSEAYNSALIALKDFRDSHMIIVTLYIIQPSKRLAKEEAERQGIDVGTNHEVKGSAGGELAHLLKDFRERTTDALLRIDV